MDPAICECVWLMVAVMCVGECVCVWGWVGGEYLCGCGCG